MELTTAWQTEELPRERLTVADEREQILFYLRGDPLPRRAGLLRGDRAGAGEGLRRHAPARRACPPSCTSAPGPAATWTATRTCTPRRIRETLARQQQVIVNSYFHECQELAQRLSQSASRVAGLRRARQAHRAIRDAAARRARHHPGAPRPHALPGVPGADRRAAARRLRRPRQRLRAARASSATTSRSSPRASRPTRAPTPACSTSSACCAASTPSAFTWRRSTCASTPSVLHEVVGAGPGRSAVARAQPRASAATCLAAGAGEGSRPGDGARRARQAHARGVRGHHAGPASLRRRAPSATSSSAAPPARMTCSRRCCWRAGRRPTTSAPARSRSTSRRSSRPRSPSRSCGATPCRSCSPTRSTGATWRPAAAGSAC